MSMTRPDTNGHFQSHYIPNTTDEQAEMLATLGIDSIDRLFADIPEEYRNPALKPVSYTHLTLPTICSV